MARQLSRDTLWLDCQAQFSLADYHLTVREVSGRWLYLTEPWPLTLSVTKLSNIYLTESEWHLYELSQMKIASPVLSTEKWKWKSAQSCPSLCDPMGYTVHGVLQARILEWVAFPFSRGSSQPRDRTHTVHGVLQARILEWVAFPYSRGSSQPRDQTHTVHGVLQARILEWVAFPFSRESSQPRDRTHTVHGVLQARILEWVAFPFSRGSSQPRDWTQVSRIAGRFFTSWATREAQALNGITNKNLVSPTVQLSQCFNMTFMIFPYPLLSLLFSI